MSRGAKRRTGGGRRQGPAARLRREAMDDRPAFSEVFHERLVRRISPDARPAPGRREAGFRDRRWLVPAGVAAALLIAAVVVLAPPARPPAGSGGVLAIRQAPPPADVGVGVERLPMFDEIESEVVDGIGSLAAEVVGLPPWGDLAAFDVRSLLASDGTTR